MILDEILARKRDEVAARRRTVPVERLEDDALFHEARVRKLVELQHLHLRSVDELAHGGLHPGYISLQINTVVSRKTTTMCCGKVSPRVPAR